MTPVPMMMKRLLVTVGIPGATVMIPRMAVMIVAMPGVLENQSSRMITGMRAKPREAGDQLKISLYRPFRILWSTLSMPTRPLTYNFPLFTTKVSI
jgi:hypothetical protein